MGHSMFIGHEFFWVAVRHILDKTKCLSLVSPLTELLGSGVLQF